MHGIAVRHVVVRVPVIAERHVRRVAHVISPSASMSVQGIGVMSLPMMPVTYWFVHQVLLAVQVQVPDQACSSAIAHAVQLRAAIDVA